MAGLNIKTFDLRGHLSGFSLGAVRNAFGHLYARRFFGSVAAQVLAVMGLVEAIFLAERFPMVFRDVLKNNANLLDTSLIFACTSTQIFDLALAIAILMAVYWTTLQMRENRELLVLFAAGRGPFQLIALTLIVAVAAQIGSLAVSGVIDPTSRYTQRVILFDAEFRALRSGSSTGQFYYYPQRVAYVPPQSDTRDHAGPDQGKKLFVFEKVQDGTFRVITADRARLDGPDAAGNMLLKLGGFTSHLFSDPPPAAGAAPAARGDGQSRGAVADPLQGVLDASDVTKEITVNELLPFPPRGNVPAELTIFDELAARWHSTEARQRDDMRMLGERFARSLLCLLAPLMALAALCLTSRATHYIALPLACMALMSLNLMSAWLIRTIGPLGPVGALAAPAALTVVCMAALLVTIVRWQGDLARPQLARA